MAHKGGFKNIKLGKNVHRQMKRRSMKSSQFSVPGSQFKKEQRETGNRKR